MGRLYKPFIFYESQIEKKTSLARSFSPPCSWAWFVRAVNRKPAGRRPVQAGHRVLCGSFAGRNPMGLLRLDAAPNTLLFAGRLLAGRRRRPQSPETPQGCRIGGRGGGQSGSGVLLVHRAPSLRRKLDSRPRGLAHDHGRPDHRTSLHR